MNFKNDHSGLYTPEIISKKEKLLSLFQDITGKTIYIKQDRYIEKYQESRTPFYYK
jgi:hypothetical protein